MFHSDYDRSGKLRTWESPVTVHILSKLKLGIYFPLARKKEIKAYSFYVSGVYFLSLVTVKRFVPFRKI